MFQMAMDTKTTPPEFLEWLDRQLRDHEWSDSNASRRAGLSRVAIYDIRSGLRPGVKKCRALARLFGYPEDYVMRLAGHLEPLRPASGGAEADPVRAELIRQISDELYKLPVERGRRIAEAFLVLVQAEGVADHASKADVLPEPADRE